MTVGILDSKTDVRVPSHFAYKIAYIISCAVEKLNEFLILINDKSPVLYSGILTIIS